MVALVGWVVEQGEHTCTYTVYCIAGVEKDLRGVVNVIDDYAVYFDGDNGEILRREQVPQDMRAQLRDLKSELVENLTNVDEEMAEIYLDDRQPTDHQGCPQKS